MDAIAKMDFPYYPSTMVLSKALLCFAASSSITVALFHTLLAIKRQRASKGSDIEQEKTCPHRMVTENLPDFHILSALILLLFHDFSITLGTNRNWHHSSYYRLALLCLFSSGYVSILLLSVVMAVIASQVGHSGLSLLGLFTSLSFSCLLR